MLRGDAAPAKRVWRCTPARLTKWRTRHIGVTHVGSLPRGPELVPLLLARDKGEAYDAAEFDRVVQAAVDEAVRKQVATGVSVVSDGELGKVGYSTYVIERLAGFGGHSRRASPRSTSPRARAGEEAQPHHGRAGVHPRRAIGKVELVNLQPLHDDIRRFRTALDRHGNGVRAFMNSASPGLSPRSSRTSSIPRTRPISPISSRRCGPSTRRSSRPASSSSSTAPTSR